MLSSVWLYDTIDCSPPGYFIYGDSPCRNTGVGCCVFLQGIFPTQVSNPGFPHYRWIFTIRGTRKPFEPWRLWNNKCWFRFCFFNFKPLNFMVICFVTIYYWYLSFEMPMAFIASPLPPIHSLLITHLLMGISHTNVLATLVSNLQSECRGKHLDVHSRNDFG